MLTSMSVIGVVSICVWSAKEKVLELKYAESLNVTRHSQFLLYKVSPFFLLLRLVYNLTYSQAKLGRSPEGNCMEIYLKAPVPVPPTTSFCGIF